MDDSGDKGGGPDAQGGEPVGAGRSGDLSAGRLAARWFAWFGVCIGVGVALGLAMLPSRTEAMAEARAAPPALRSASVAAVPVGTASFTPRRPGRLGRGAARGTRPRIAIVIDDLGLSRTAFERVNALPGPLTLAFLPYGEDAQAMLDDTRPVHEPILHLPTEPISRVEDAGPDMLRVASAPAIRRALETNLAKLSGYEGVNNHTGSRFTGDAAAMRVLLSELDARGLYFLDSLTTPMPVAQRLAAARGWRVAARDVFLDDDYDGGEAAVRRQLAELERIARAEGQAVAIGHPYKATVKALGPWLVTAQARGFELVTVSALSETRAPPALARLR